MLCRYSSTNGDGRRRCEKANTPCLYPDAPNHDKCELTQEITEKKARKAGRIIKKFCTSQFRHYNCKECPIYDMCNTPPYTWADESKDGELNGM